MYTFLDQRASPDTNIPSSLFIIPILIFLILLVALCGRLSSQTARLQSTVSDLRVSMGDIEVFTVLICIHVITVAINLFFYCVGKLKRDPAPPTSLPPLPLTSSLSLKVGDQSSMCLYGYRNNLYRCA